MKIFKGVTSHYGVICILTLTTIEGINVSMLSPLFPLSAKRKLVSTAWIGLISGVADVTALLSAFLLPLILRPENLELCYTVGACSSGLLLLTFGCIVQIWNSDLLIILCFINRALAGVAAALLYTCAFPVATGLIPSKMGLIISIMQSNIGIGITAGPPIGSYLFELGGIMLPFTIIGLAECLCSFVLPCFVSSKDPSIEKKELISAFSKSLFMRYILQPATLAFSMPYFCVMIFSGLRDVSISLFLFTEFQLDEKSNFLVFFIYGLSQIFFSPLIGMFVDKGFSGAIYFVGIITSAIAMIGILCLKLPLLHSTASIYVLMALNSFSCVSLNITSYIILSKEAEKLNCESKSMTKFMASSWMSCMRSFGKCIGCWIVGGLLYDILGFINCCITLFAFTLISGFVAISLIFMQGYFLKMYID